MRKVLVILLFVVGITISDRVSIVDPSADIEHSISDLHHEQLCCNHRYNLDAESTSSIAVPSVRTTTTLAARSSQQRISTVSFIGHLYTVTKYPVTRFIYRLGSFARAIDFYLYVFCVLRL